MSFRSMLSAGKEQATRVNIKQETYLTGGIYKAYKYGQVTYGPYMTDSYGGYLKSWGVVHWRIPCRFNALTTKELGVVAHKQEVKADFSVYLQYISGIKEGDRLIDLSDSREYEISLVMDWDEDRSMMKLAVSEMGRLG